MNTTAIACLLSAAIAGGGAWAYQNHRYAAQLADVQLSYSKRDFKALEAQYADTIRLQKKADDAQAKAAVRIRTLAADRDILRGAVDGLRGDLAANSAKYAEATEQARANYTAAVSAVLADMARVAGDISSKADGHVIDIQRLHEQWPE